MKKAISVCLWSCTMFLLLSPAAFAQNKMVIHFKDGQKQTININNIQRIEYETSSETSGDSSGLSTQRSYEIIAKNSGKCLDVAGVATNDGANVQQWSCHGEKNQAWKLTSKGQGYYAITAQNSGKCLDVAGVSNDRGANVHQWSCHGGDNQSWMLIPQGGGYYLITAKHSGKCLDVASAGTGDGANVQQWDCHSGENQLWRLK
jgi:hypothetical protein